MGLFGRGNNKGAAAAADAAVASQQAPIPANDDAARLLAAAEEAKPPPAAAAAAAPAATTAAAAADPAAAKDAAPASRRGSALERNVSGRRASSLIAGEAPPLPDEWRAKTGEHLDPAPLKPHRRRLLLLACICILGNELCERLAYYSIQTNMGLYLKKQLGYPAEQASQLLQAWKGTVYLTPLIGAYLADAVIGRFWVILTFSSLYAISLAGLTLVNWIPALKPVNGAPPPGAATLPVFWVSLYLMALGSGGIKPVVSSFGADQFDDHSARERAWRASFFNIFYFTINVGSLVAALVIVPIQESRGYALGFGIPTAAFVVAILAFLIGWPLYKIYPPQGSPFARLFRVLRGAWRNRGLALPSDPAELHEDDPGAPLRAVPEEGSERGGEGGASARGAASGALGDDAEEEAAAKVEPVGGDSGGKKRLFGRKKNKKAAAPPKEPAKIERMPHTEGMAFLDKAAIRGAVHGRSATPITVSMVEESKAFYRIMPIFALVIVYQLAYDPIFTLLPYPGDVMDRRMGSSGAEIPASSISFANTFGVLFTLPFYDMVLVPLMTKLKRPITITQRIGAGFFVEILALVSAGIIESVRYRQSAGVRALYEADGGGPNTETPDPLDPRYVQPMSIWVQIVPYYLLGASEAFTNVGVMELFYVGVSTGMRSIGTACYLLTVALGTYGATALNLIIGAATAKDPWVANNSLYGHYDWYFYLNAGILALALLVYIPVSRRYVERPVTDADGDPFDLEGRAHGELANVSRVWPSVSRQSRVSELRMRSHASSATAGAGLALPTSARDARASATALAAEQAGVWERPGG